MPFTIKTDILVVGSGLAAYRAAISALEHTTGPKVLIVSNRSGPSGSSFTNINKSLGIVVLSTDNEKELFVERAAAIAPPGKIHNPLVTILAEESLARFIDMVDMGFAFIPSQNETYKRFSCCFLQTPTLARIISDLPGAFSSMNNRFNGSGGTIIDNARLVSLLKTESGCIAGALFFRTDSHDFFAVQSNAVIIATGGPSCLFGRSLSGAGCTGQTPAVLKQAGCKFVNMGFFQFLWYDTQRLTHWPPWSVGSGDTIIHGPDNDPVDVPDTISDLCSARSSHVPVSWGMPDSDLDAFLFKNMNSNGELTITRKNQNPARVAPFAHACNGGVVINSNGFTGIPGLYACGEAAGGMHGANRIGGAMVLSTQVFGHRAGIAASIASKNAADISKRSFHEITAISANKLKSDINEWKTGKQEIALILQQAFFNENYDCYNLVKTLMNRLDAAEDWLFRLSLETLLIILNDKTNLHG